MKHLLDMKLILLFLLLLAGCADDSTSRELQRQLPDANETSSGLKLVLWLIVIPAFVLFAVWRTFTPAQVKHDTLGCGEEGTESTTVTSNTASAAAPVIKRVNPAKGATPRYRPHLVLCPNTFVSGLPANEDVRIAALLSFCTALITAKRRFVVCYVHDENAVAHPCLRDLARAHPKYFKECDSRGHLRRFLKSDVVWRKAKLVWGDLGIRKDIQNVLTPERLIRAKYSKGKVICDPLGLSVTAAADVNQAVDALRCALKATGVKLRTAKGKPASVAPLRKFRNNGHTSLKT